MDRNATDDRETSDLQHDSSASAGPSAETKVPRHGDADQHIGAVEGDRPTDLPNQGNPHGTGLDDQGMPNDPVATCEDAIGANVDKTEGG